MKFIFPNQFDVYLHDTPADNLFARTDRGFSHGCVRVEKPLELAEYVLRSQPEWTRERIPAAMHSGSEKWVTLKQPLPCLHPLHDGVDRARRRRCSSGRISMATTRSSRSSCPCCHRPRHEWPRCSRPLLDALGGAALVSRRPWLRARGRLRANLLRVSEG